ncbi:C-type mannose receptor 2-like [Oratosquilla oratoria]|uniref:C-type mannose receptor 2-like n=1 Tax=Oratosquilla oratoria TaxID=337810 RepID=UPI003F76E8EA
MAHLITVLFGLAGVCLASTASSSDFYGHHVRRGSCPPGFHHVQGRCYSLGDEYVTWQGCWDSCKDNKAEMASFETMEEHQALSQFMLANAKSAFYWVGGVMLDDGSWRWVSGAPLAPSTMQWYHSPAGSLFRQSVIFRLEDFRMKPTHGSDVNVCLCEMAKSSKCPAKYEEVNGRCLRFREVESTWEEARDWCHAINGDLAVIPSLKDHDVMAGRMLAMGKETGPYWVGARAQVKGYYQWVTGDPVLHMTWKDNFPQSSDGCAQMDPWSGFSTTDASCSSTAYSICQLRA